MGTENWFDKKDEELPYSSHHKYVITGMKRVRQPRRYVQSVAEAQRELNGIGDCKKVPASTLHHANLFVGKEEIKLIKTDGMYLY